MNQVEDGRNTSVDKIQNDTQNRGQVAAALLAFLLQRRSRGWCVVHGLILGRHNLVILGRRGEVIEIIRRVRDLRRSMLRLLKGEGGIGIQRSIHRAKS